MNEKVRVVAILLVLIIGFATHIDLPGKSTPKPVPVPQEQTPTKKIFKRHIDPPRTDIDNGYDASMECYDAPIYEYPGTKAKVVGRIPHNERLKVGSQNQGWSHIRFKGIEGYVASRCLEKVEATGITDF